MNNQRSKSGYQLYFIAIIPPSPVYDEALDLKNYFKEKYNSKASLNSPPHITLQPPFEWEEEKEQELIEFLGQFVNERESINIELDGFSAFPPRVIFLSVKRNEYLDQLQRELQKFCESKLNLANIQNTDRPFHPHLTLAFRDLRRQKFVEAWSEFKEKPFSNSFVSEHFTLLKHDGKVWQPIHHFPFLNRSAIH